MAGDQHNELRNGFEKTRLVKKWKGIGPHQIRKGQEEYIYKQNKCIFCHVSKICTHCGSSPPKDKSYLSVDPGVVLVGCVESKRKPILVIKMVFI